MNAEAILERLVGFATVSRASNLPLIDWVEEWVTPFGGRCRRTWNDEGTKANLLVSFGPEGPGGILLSGHTDVVPAEEGTWHQEDPFRLTRRDGRLYGRGTADMKGFLAAVLAQVPEMGGAGAPPLAHPIHLALSYDEEVGCLGAPRLIEDLLAAGLKPAMAIVGEPTEMQLARAHKSVNLFRTEVRGLEAHSSQPHLGAGAILAASRLLAHLWDLGVRAQLEGDPLAMGFKPPWTTVQAGQIEGGTAANILPGRCTFSWEYRTLPGQDPDEIFRSMTSFCREVVLPDLTATAPEATIATEVLARVPALQPEGNDTAVVRLVRSLLPPDPVAGEGQSGVVSYGTEGGQFQEAGIPTVLCGPGSIDVAHRPNEFLEVAQIQKCTHFIQAILSHCRVPYDDLTFS
jgi:acetylornithine deacetylase